MKRKPKVESVLIGLIRQGATQVRLPDWPPERHVRLKFPGPEATLYEGERRLQSFAIDWNNPNWERAA
jgi:hypothetical protein